MTKKKALLITETKAWLKEIVDCRKAIDELLARGAYRVGPAIQAMIRLVVRGAIDMGVTEDVLVAGVRAYYQEARPPISDSEILH